VLKWNAISRVATDVVERAFAMNREFRLTNMAAVGNARIMGGTVGQMRTLQRTFDAYDNYLGMQKGWSEGMFTDFRDRLGLTAKNATGLLDKIRQAALPENLGAEAADSLGHHIVEINKRMREQKQQMQAMGVGGQFVRMTARQIRDEFNDNVPLQKIITEQLQKQNKLYYDQKEINQLINNVMDQNAHTKLPSPDEVMPVWQKFELFLANNIASTIHGAEESLAQLLGLAEKTGSIANGGKAVDNPLAIGGRMSTVIDNLLSGFGGVVQRKNNAVTAVNNNSLRFLPNSNVGPPAPVNAESTTQTRIASLKAWGASDADIVSMGGDLRKGLLKGLDPKGMGGDLIIGMREGTQTHSPSQAMVKFGHDLAAGQAIGMQQGNRAVTAAAMPQVSNSISLHQHNSISVNGNDSQNLGQSLASSGTQFFAQELAKAGIMTGAS
jgi:hypothetical protein